MGKVYIKGWLEGNRRESKPITIPRNKFKFSCFKEKSMI